MKRNKVKPTEQQKKAVNGVMQGKSMRSSMITAGYSEKTASAPSKNFLARAGVQVYLKKFDKVSRQKFGMNLQDKLISTFTDGLESTKLYGKSAVVHPDFSTRFVYANKLSDLIGMTKQTETPQQTNNQYNFFQTSPEEQRVFHEKLKEFIRGNSS